jgi:PA domain-containing protein
MKHLFKKLPTFLLASVLGLFVYSSAFAQATIVIQNNDAPGAGFNDTTAAAPVGGNNGTTVGAQRLIAFQAAANIWGATLTSGPTITIRATWAALPCTAGSGTLGSAGPAGSGLGFPGGLPGFWYPISLANALSGTDLNSGAHEINATFNSSLGTTGCLENSHWYYGLDNNHGSSGIDLVNVLLHEFAHGLGFQTFTNRTTGQQAQGSPSIYDRYLFDNQTGKTWPQMTDAERSVSATNTGRLVWNGPQVLNDVLGVLSGAPRLRVNSPGSIAGNYQIGTANFGPGLTPAGATANTVQALDAADGAGPSTTDGCSPFSNVAAVSGNIALIDRGTCSFIAKTRNAQNAGAVGVIIADNDPANNPPPGLGGGPDNTITIPAVRVTQADGNTIKAQLSGGVNATMFIDTTTVAGTDSAHRPLMFAPNPLVGGSSVAHWDTTLSPNQLMEPNDSSDLFHSVTIPQDLTFSLLKDIGWPGNVSAPVTILTEQGNATAAAAVDSVTRLRGPFTVMTPNNFSGDGLRRIIIFTTDLGLNPGDNLSVLTVQAQGNSLIVEAAGPLNGLAQTSYIIVRLPAGLPAGNLPLTVTLRGVNSSNNPTIGIIP